MKIYNNLLSKDECEHLKQFWEDHKKDAYVNYQVGDQIHDVKIMLTEEHKTEWKIVQHVIDKIFHNPLDTWVGLCEAYMPLTLHNDIANVFFHRLPYNYFTVILSLDTIPEFKTFIWNEVSNSNAHLIKEYCKIDQGKKLTNISETEDLEHTVKNSNGYIVDFLAPPDVYSYQQGTAIAFDSKRIHCTNNWPKFGRSSRQLFQIHTVADGIK